MNSHLDNSVQECTPVVGAPPVPGVAGGPCHGRWQLLEASGQPVPMGDPLLAGISVALRYGYLVLRAPGMLRLDIPLDVIEDDPSLMETLNLAGETVCVVDEGAWAAEWFSQVLGRPVRLVKRCPPEIPHSD